MSKIIVKLYPDLLIPYVRLYPYSMLSTWFGSGIAILNTSDANICASFTNSINSEVLKSDVPRFSWNTSPSKTLSCKITESPYFWIIRSVIS